MKKNRYKYIKQQPQNFLHLYRLQISFFSYIFSSNGWTNESILWQLHLSRNCFDLYNTQHKGGNKRRGFSMGFFSYLLRLNLLIQYFGRNLQLEVHCQNKMDSLSHSITRYHGHYFSSFYTCSLNQTESPDLSLNFSSCHFFFLTFATDLFCFFTRLFFSLPFHLVCLCYFVPTSQEWAQTTAWPINWLTRSTDWLTDCPVHPSIQFSSSATATAAAGVAAAAVAGCLAAVARL